MTKTEKLNLPQWEAADVVKRADFNDAFSILDNGYAAAMTAAEEARTLAGEMATDVALVISEATADAEAKNFVRACRAANLAWHTAVETDAQWRLGAFAQQFGSDYGSSVSGTVQRSDCVWMCNGDGMLTSQALTKAATRVTDISSSTGSATCTMTFTPPYSGRLTQLRLTGNYTGNDGIVNNGACTMTLTNLTTGQVEVKVNASLGFNFSGSKGTFPVDVDWLLHGAQQYRLDVTLNALDITVNLYPDLTATSNYALTCVGYQLAEASVSKTAAGEESLGGIALAHYTTWGNGGALSLTWDGETISPACTRTITDQAGRTVQEAEFRKNSTIPASSSLTLNLACEAGGELSLYDWGAMML